MTISQVAKRSGVGVETVRFYEKRGLLSPRARSSAGYRFYSEDAVARIEFIKHSQELGFSLEEIKDLLELRTNPDTSCADVRIRAKNKLSQVREKIHSLRKMEIALERLVVSCKGKGPTSECPILDEMAYGTKTQRDG